MIGAYTMKIEILNYTSTGIAKFLETLEKNLPNGMCPSPITLDLSFFNITVDCNNQMTVTNYDYFSNNGTTAEFTVEDTNMLFDDLEWNHNSIKVNDEIFYLDKATKNTPK